MSDYGVQKEKEGERKRMIGGLSLSKSGFYAFVVIRTTTFSHDNSNTKAWKTSSLFIICIEVCFTKNILLCITVIDFKLYRARLWLYNTISSVLARKPLIRMKYIHNNHKRVCDVNLLLDVINKSIEQISFMMK